MNTLDSLQIHISKNLRLALFFSLFLYTLGLIVLLPLAGIIMTGFYGLHFSELTQILTGNFAIHPDGIQIFRLMQAISQVVTWGVGGLVMTWLMGIFPQVLGFHKPVPLLSVFLPVLIIFTSIPLVQAVHISPELSIWPEMWKEWLSQWASEETASQEHLMVILGEQKISTLLVNLFIFALLPAVCEELFFRGFLQKRLSDTWSPQIAIWTAAIIFSFAHFQFLSFFSRLLLAWLLGYFFHTTHRLFPCIIAHFGYNAATILLVYFSSGTNSTAFTPFVGGVGIDWEIVLLSAVATGILLWIFTKLYKSPDSLQITHE
ncbi:MAG: CPBP family intramembrane glutamic endopeptidase [Bacteroidia bacterium]